MTFDSNAFQKFSFTDEQLARLLEGAMRDLSIAKHSELSEVRFKFTYDALIKMGLLVIAKEGYRVRSASGHHVWILQKTSELLNNGDLAVIGNVMRQKRNRDLYDGVCTVSEKEAIDYLVFVGKLGRMCDR